MKFNKIIATTLIGTMLMTSLAGCGSDTETPAPTTETTESAGAEATAMVAEGEKILNLNNLNEPGTLHPGLSEGVHESWVLDHCFEGLFRKTPEGTVENALADTVTISEDGLTYTITLKDGGMWSNGDPVVAQDFTEEWLWVLDPLNASVYAGSLHIFKGAKEYNSGTGTREDVAIKAIDDKTLEFTLNSPMAYIEDYMTHYTFYPVNHKVQAENPDWHTSGDTYVSNGPFVMTSWKHKESIDLTKNDSYREADRINLDGAHLIILADQISSWQAYQTGDLDLNLEIPADVLGGLVASNDPELVVAPELSTYMFNFNTQYKPFNNAKVRKALSMSLDRDIIVKTVTQGGETPAYGITPPGVPDEGMAGDYQENLGPLFEEDVVEAQRLLAEGLAEEGMTIEEFKPTLLYSTSELHKRIAETAQNMWKTNLGIDVAIENAEFQVMLDRRHQGDFELVRYSWVGDYVDPMTFLDLFITGSSNNDGKWTNAEYDELIAMAQVEQDPVKRFEYLKQAETILIQDEMAVIPVYFYTQPYVLKPYVTGIYKPVNRYPQFQYADIEPHE